MESFIKLQNDIVNNISKSQINLRKSKSRITESYIESRLENLEKQWDKFNTNHSQMVTLTDKDKTYDYFTNNLYENAEEMYLDYKAELKGHLKTFINLSQNSQSSTSSGSGSKYLESNIKLPRVTLPTFSGSYNEWVSFRDLFVSLIHKNSTLDDVQKLHYLKSHLTSEAEQLLRHVPITAQNYQVCWSQLEKRYNNKRFLANCILKRFMSQKNLALESSSAIKELLDTSNECLHALNNLGIETNSWDVLVIHILSLKLDHETRKLWEVKLSDLNEELPKLSDFFEFLEHRFRALEFLINKPNQTNKTKSIVKTLHVTNNISCIFCKEAHKLINCKKFCKEDVDARRNFVQANRLCFNCLGVSHSAFSCRQPTRCQIPKCNKRHHSLLHPRGTEQPGEGDRQPSQSLGQSSNIVPQPSPTLGRSNIIEPKQSSSTEVGTHNIVTCFSNISSQVLLATALVKVEARNSYNITVRALLDQGSQASFITEATVQLLGLKKIYTNSNVFGLGDDHHRSVVSKAVVSLKLQSLRDPSFSIVVKAHVLKKLTSFLPETKVEIQAWKELEQIELADPLFHTPNKIDVLLGADVYGQILLNGIIKGPAGCPVAQNTKLGWIISGQVGSDINKSPKCNTSIISMHVHSEINENDLLRKFWELEAEPKENEMFLTEEEKKCEEIFSKNTKRDEFGRYIVKLPFRSSDPLCKYGNSKEIALRRFLMLERKLEKDKKLQKDYSNVIQEYLDLGHMEVVPEDEEDTPGAVYLPHHAVIREEKDTSKVRVVFDASCAGINGASLNTDLMIGPTLQPDLRTLLMRWRLNPICLVADIEKMYRQVKVSREDVDFQRILWRDPTKQESEIKSYRLLTVTFGTASAPYLAVKVLQQTAYDEGKDSPTASEKIINEFYMDDFLSGCQSIEEGKQIHKEIKEILKKGGFMLKKWSSNKKKLLTEIKEEGEDGKGNLEIKMDKILKILGLTWDRTSDGFQYVVHLPTSTQPVTKRKVISEISKLFDPLGWLAPSIIIAKILIQKIWLSGIEWDQELTPTLLKEWCNYRNELTELAKFKIPRWTNTSVGDICVQLHGFSDASNEAYAAVIYIRVVDAQGDVHVSLVTSKTKVAPIKQVSIPRLELCGAVLLSKLLREASEVLKIPRTNIRAWTDSTVVLAWLSSHPGRWKTFIANRVSEIITHFDRSHWSHVQSKDNPADCASRGVKPAELAELQLWKNGPAWLKQKDITVDKNEAFETKIEEKAKKVYHTTISEEDNIFTRFSNLRRLTRVIAFCRRMLPGKNQEKTSWLKADEINEALMVCVKRCQNQYFEKEIENLSRKAKIEKKSKLTSLTPYIDDAGILRVGGRLEKAEIGEDRKHPIILPAKSHLTDLIIADAHERLLHGGTQLMVNYLRSKYWILDVKNRVKFYIRQCVKCIRHAAQRREQLMGQLPKARVTMHRPFHQSGVDYAGPISIRTSKGRGYKAYKGYICLFICMSTRAVHLEAVTDLTSQGFLAAFKRFVARRGHCADLYSDNGTNFIGASKELKALLAAERSSVATEIADCLATNGTNWHFIPPHSPNFGGLWEAGIKSTKNHLKRTIGNSTLTFEEMTTVLSQIEACLNSRPISQLSNDPNNISPLTSGHFLIGEPLVLVPEDNYEKSNLSSLKRWQLTQRMVQEFWRRWSQEYLTQFMHRYKWAQVTPEPKVGDIVLVMENNLPPSGWLYGRITAKHPGADQLTRVVSLQSKGSIIKRPVSKLCILPVTE